MGRTVAKISESKRTGRNLVGLVTIVRGLSEKSDPRAFRSCSSFQHEPSSDGSYGTETR